MNENRLKRVNTIAIILIYIGSFYLLYKYSLGEFASDYPAHIKQALRGDGYSLAAIIINFFCGLLNSKLIFALFMALVITTTAIICAMFIKKVLILMSIDEKSNVILFLAILSLFICKICIPEWSDMYYKGSLSTQCWHNSTYTLMKPLSLICLVYFFKIQKDYKSNLNIKDCILFTIFLFFTNFSKPSFVLGFAPIMLIVLIIDFIKTKGKSFKNAFIFGCCVLVSCSILIYIYNKSFGITSDGENTIAFSISNFINYFINNKKYPLYFLLSFAYPIYITVLTIKNRNRIDNYSKIIFIEIWAMYILSFLESLLLVEVGPRAADGNFGWGSQFFSYALFIVSICMNIKLYKENIISKEENAIAKYTYYLHIVFGIFYFALLLMGYHYYF